MVVVEEEEEEVSVVVPVGSWPAAKNRTPTNASTSTSTLTTAAGMRRGGVGFVLVQTVLGAGVA